MATVWSFEDTDGTGGIRSSNGINLRSETASSNPIKFKSGTTTVGFCNDQGFSLGAGNSGATPTASNPLKLRATTTNIRGQVICATAGGDAGWDMVDDANNFFSVITKGTSAGNNCVVDAGVKNLDVGFAGSGGRMAFFPSGAGETFRVDNLGISLDGGATHITSSNSVTQSTGTFFEF